MHFYSLEEERENRESGKIIDLSGDIDKNEGNLR
jgi:hypothetical protein